MDDLKAIRDIWLECYRNGDVKGLMKYESESLTVINDGVIDSGNRYQNIQECVNNGRWFQPEMATVVTYKEKVHHTQVVGYCKIMSGKRKGLKLQIQEIWNKNLDEWQLEQLKINA
jgi:hypothetical protein